jgi:outer membrane protein assembly factor BamB
MRLALLILGATILSGADWPRFRGPNGGGVADGPSLPVEFSPGRNMAWKAKVPPGTSSPIVAGQRVFLTAHEGDQRLVLALDVRTGEELWRRGTAKTRTEPFNPLHGPVTPTPVSDGTNVYAFFPEVGLISYGPRGEERWRTPLGPFHSVQGIATSPILADGKVILFIDQIQDSYLAAFDPATGKQVWKKDRPSGFLGGYSTPVVWESQVIVSGALELTGYRVDTGEKIWWVRGLTNAPASTPVVSGQNLYVHDLPGEPQPFEPMLKMDKNKDGKLSLDEVDPIIGRIVTAVDREWGNHDGAVDAAEWEKAFGSFNGHGGVAAVRLGGKGDVGRTHVRWTYQKSLPYIPSVLLYQGVVYVVRDGGIVTALNPETGEVLRQDRVKEAIDKYYASPVAGDGKVYLVSEEGKVSVLKAGPQWEMLATNDLGERCYATPALANGHIYIRTKESLYCFTAPRQSQPRTQ